MVLPVVDSAPDHDAHLRQRSYLRQLPLSLRQGDLKLAGIVICASRRLSADLLTFLKVQGDELTVHAATHRNGIRGGHGTQPAQIARYGLRGRGRGLYRRQVSSRGTAQRPAAAVYGAVRRRPARRSGFRYCYAW